MKDETAVSPVIGTILMVAITVILAAVIAVFGFGFGGFDSKGPSASIALSNVPETIGIYDMKITHKAGDRLKANDWKISIVPAGQSPVYQASSSDFQVGDQILTTILTNGDGIYTVNNRTIEKTGTPSNFVPDIRYEVKIIVFPYKTMVIDAVVVLR